MKPKVIDKVHHLSARQAVSHGEAKFIGLRLLA
jgi:hypothetical protein